MVCSPARMAANRENSKKSTGPKDTSRTRFNAYKHGMTASGIALPSEDQAEMERRFQDIATTLNPQNEVEAILARRFAFLSVRLDRCQRYDTAMLAGRDRHASTAYDQQQTNQIIAYAEKLPHDPVTVVRHLRAIPEGLQYLGRSLLALRDQLEDRTRVNWRQGDCSALHDLLGEPNGPTRFNRTTILSEALYGYFGNTPAGEWPGMSDAEKSEAARTELLAIIDAEMAVLKSIHDALDHDAFAQDRAEAPDRALFDPGKDATLSRKYEASTERSLFRTLKELRQVAAMAREVEPVIEPPVPTEPPVEEVARGRGSLASFFPMPEGPVAVEGSRPFGPPEPGRIVAEGRPDVVSEPFQAARE